MRGLAPGSRLSAAFHGPVGPERKRSGGLLRGRSPLGSVAAGDTSARALAHVSKAGCRPNLDHLRNSFPRGPAPPRGSWAWYVVANDTRTHS